MSRYSHELDGQRFSAWLVLARAEPDGNRQQRWWCRCACGSTRPVLQSNLLRGQTTSCGCGAAEGKRPRSGPHLPPELLTYNGANSRLRAALGPASAHPCVDCGAPATQWSYCYSDPGELTEVRARCAAPSPYSADPAHYRPRCARDHASFARLARAFRARQSAGAR